MGRGNGCGVSIWSVHYHFKLASVHNINSTNLKSWHGSAPPPFLAIQKFSKGLLLKPLPPLQGINCIVAGGKKGRKSSKCPVSFLQTSVWKFLPSSKSSSTLSNQGGNPSNEKPPLAEPDPDWLPAGEIVPDDATPMGRRLGERGNQSD